MKNNTAQGFGSLLILLLVAVFGTSGYFLFTNKDKVVSYISQTKTQTQTQGDCISQEEYDELMAQAYEANDENSIKYLEEMVDEIICTATIQGKNPEIEPPLPPTKGDKYAEYQYNNCFFCESDMQVCQTCWSNEADEKVCCLKSVEDNFDDEGGKNRCREGDRFLDPNQVERCK